MIHILLFMQNLIIQNNIKMFKLHLLGNNIFEEKSKSLFKFHFLHLEKFNLIKMHSKKKKNKIKFMKHMHDM